MADVFYRQEMQDLKTLPLTTKKNPIVHSFKMAETFSHILSYFDVIFSYEMYFSF